MNAAGLAKRCSARGNHAYSIDPPIPWYTDASGNLVLGNVCEMSCEPGGSAPNAQFGYGAVEGRHKGSAHAVFADGHVSSMTPEEFGYVVRPDGSFAERIIPHPVCRREGPGGRRKKPPRTARVIARPPLDRPLVYRNCPPGCESASRRSVRASLSRAPRRHGCTLSQGPWDWQQDSSPSLPWLPERMEAGAPVPNRGGSRPTLRGAPST